MRKFYIIFLTCTYLVYAQSESQSQSIELPDFVITGKESISIPKIQKSIADFIPLLSKDFFTPDFPNYEKTEVKLPEVETEVLGYDTYKQGTNALLRFSGGLETWPSGEFYYNDWTENFSYNLNIKGYNELEYIKHAGLSNAGGSLGGKYFVDNNSGFLPGLEISLKGEYNYENFNYYGYQPDPGLERTTDDGEVKLLFNYLNDPYNNFGFTLKDSYFNQRDLETDENIIGISAYYKFKYNNFDLKLEGLYNNQSLSSSLFSTANQYYFTTAASAGILLYDILNLKAGVYLSEMEGNTFFSPTVYGSIKLNRYFSVFGSFAPHTEFLTMRDFHLSNRYYQTNGIFNTFIENKSDLKFAIKFEYEKYFEINGGVGYLNSDNNFYFEDDITPGLFNLKIVDSENYFAFVNFLFRKGPFGQFYGDLKFQKVTVNNDNELPYNPNLLGNLTYAYDWENGVGLKFKLYYLGSTYTDLNNSSQINETIDFGTSFYYSIFSNFKLTLEFQNLFDKKYFYFKNYSAKPFDLLAGFEFRW